MSSQERVRRSTRARCRKPVLDVDLNVVPPCENRGQEGTSDRTGQGDNTLHTPIDLEAVDDDVVISSPRAFAEAKNNAKNNARNRGRTIVVDVESEERSARCKRRRIPTNQTIINCDLYISLDSSSNSSRDSGQNKQMPPPPPPPKEPTFSCPVCMGPLVEETSTKCGHIFCKTCIKTAIAAQSKCPTCRRKTTTRDIFRVYLPATRSS